MEYLKAPSNVVPHLSISRLGLGTMRMTDKKEGIAAIHAALDAGINFLNTGDFYDAGANEMMVGEALKGRKRDEAFVSVKFGALQRLDHGMYGIDVRPESVENYLVYSLKRLGLEYIDLYQPGRINPHIPVEETIGAISGLVQKGYVKTIGITEVSADVLRRAHATHPITLVEVTYSLMNRIIENDVIPTARELGISIAGFGVLLAGLIGGRSQEQALAMISRMVSPETLANFNHNIVQANALQQIADEKEITLAQLAIAWVLAQGEDIMALVGSRTVEQVEGTLNAMEIRLSREDLNRIEKIIPKADALSKYMPEINLDKNGLFKR
jgi:aryl-alcohol dehydrogenase-like predicted oxidoreductase